MHKRMQKTFEKVRNIRDSAGSEPDSPGLLIRPGPRLDSPKRPVHAVDHDLGLLPDRGWVRGAKAARCFYVALDAAFTVSFDPTLFLDLAVFESTVFFGMKESAVPDAAVVAVAAGLRSPRGVTRPDPGPSCWTVAYAREAAERVEHEVHSGAGNDQA